MRSLVSNVRETDSRLSCSDEVLKASVSAMANSCDYSWVLQQLRLRKPLGDRKDFFVNVRELDVGRSHGPQNFDLVLLTQPKQAIVDRIERPLLPKSLSSYRNDYDFGVFLECLFTEVKDSLVLLLQPCHRLLLLRPVQRSDHSHIWRNKPVPLKRVDGTVDDNSVLKLDNRIDIGLRNACQAATGVDRRQDTDFSTLLNTETATARAGVLIRRSIGKTL